jgi:uncharacterized protein YyaL (SSP411 family)
MSNHLVGENSPYLLQHVDNPVDWYPWCGDALEKASKEDKPIFLSIGYAACHWCHVMAHESFEDPDIANILNEYFVNIKVDREERTDLDTIYMSAIVAMTGSGGWPMSVFLTPDGKPFYGGTYFPPTPRHNLPSFRDVLQTIISLWKEDRQKLLASAEEITQHIRKNHTFVKDIQPLDETIVDQSIMRLAQSYDWKLGGWGRAPKFPQPMAVEFLLRQAAKGENLSRDICENVLDAMSKGGMYDVLGGGFARYSTDDQWLVPHFEKMLYDNAQLALAYLHAFFVTQNVKYREVCEKTLDFVVRELMSHDDKKDLSHGGIFSSLDADSEGVEGKFYLWDFQEIRDILAVAQKQRGDFPLNWIEFFEQAYNDISPSGNFEGRIVLQRFLSDAELADRFGITISQVKNTLQLMHSSLFEARNQRIRPALDDKVLTGWNALALTAFAEAARYLKRPDYLEIARRNADFLLTELYVDRRLLRSWRNGQAKHNAYLEDYAGLILGLLALYQSDPDPWWFTSAAQLAQEMVDHFSDPDGGFFDIRADHDKLLMRPKDLQDNATPSGNAMAAMALLQLSILTGHNDWRRKAENILNDISELAQKYPLAFSAWLSGMDFSLSPIMEVVILGKEQEEIDKFLDVVWSQFRPNIMIASSLFPVDPISPAILKNRTLLEEKTTGFICKNFVCNHPVNSITDFSYQLQQGVLHAADDS